MSDNAPSITWLGKLVIVLIIAGCAWAAWTWLRPTATPGATPKPVVASGDVVTIGVAYGTEKERWLTWAVAAFAAEEPGIHVELIPKGSLEGAQAVLAGDTAIHVWAPASSLYTPTFAADFELRHNRKPFLAEETLALTPMVFVFWDERWQALAKKPAGFRELGDLLAAPGGWGGLAQKPAWGFFKFGHTHPQQSNSGLMTLVLMAHGWHGSRDLSVAQVLDPAFQTWLTGFEKAVSGLSASTGSQMKEMVLKGPSAFDGLCVYESVAIDYLKNAQGRWGDLRVIYPSPNAWNDNPAYVLDVPWSSPAQRDAARRFLAFLMTEPVQRRALDHGFRPGNPAVPVRFEGSPFLAYAQHGLQIDLPAIISPPAPEVVQNLLAGWQRSVAR